jgi:SPP1 family predicted phage head-tail adaptor
MPSSDIFAGSLDRRITLRSADRPISGRDEFNAPIYALAPSITVWAEFKPVSDREKMAASEIVADLSARFRIRWASQVAAISPSWWIEFGDRTYNIVGVKEIGRRVGLEITASARAEQ